MNFLGKIDWFLAGVVSVMLAILAGGLLLDGKEGLWVSLSILLIFSSASVIRKDERSRAGRKMVQYAALSLVFFAANHKAVAAFLQQHVGISASTVLLILLAPVLIRRLFANVKEHMDDLRGKGEPVKTEPE
jgi:hypothetical protein